MTVTSVLLRSTVPSASTKLPTPTCALSACALAPAPVSAPNETAPLPGSSESAVYAVPSERSTLLRSTALPSDAVPLNEAVAPVAESVSSGIPTMLAENVASTACHASESLKKKAASSELIVPCRPAALDRAGARTGEQGSARQPDGVERGTADRRTVGELEGHEPLRRDRHGAAELDEPAEAHRLLARSERARAERNEQDGRRRGRGGARELDAALHRDRLGRGVADRHGAGAVRRGQARGHSAAEGRAAADGEVDGGAAGAECRPG